MRQVSRPRLTIAAAGAVLLVMGMVAILLQNAVPRDPASTLVARVVLAGPVGPDPSDQPIPTDGSDLDPQVAVSSPSAQACLARIASGSGWLDLCWEAYRVGGDADLQKDYYLLRLHGSHEGLRWLTVRSQLIGTPGDNVYDVWPDGTYAGGCRKEPVSLPVPLFDLAADDVCGRTVARRDFDHWSHQLAWTCDGCMIPGSDTNGVSMYTVVGMAEGMVPSWDVFANAGS